MQNSHLESEDLLILVPLTLFNLNSNSYPITSINSSHIISLFNSKRSFISHSDYFMTSNIITLFFYFNFIFISLFTIIVPLLHDKGKQIFLFMSEKISLSIFFLSFCDFFLLLKQLIVDDMLS